MSLEIPIKEEEMLKEEEVTELDLMLLDAFRRAVFGEKPKPSFNESVQQ